MRSQAEHTTSGAWGSTRIVALCSALLVLLATLVMCLGSVSHGDSGPVGTWMTSTHHGTTGAHPADCPYGDVCCGPSTDGVRAVLAAPVQPVPAVLPRMPRLPAPGASSRCAEPTPAGRSPDLHVLQVQRI
ncbi:hypothetical protein [Streptomyces spongiae]|uniref:Uncharacterized protein n=1 Tax=Streptomyces spongiae TaxID=565072 RepID=A0A5N8XV67_9ACTN|nr:hypothetical protein [Streptomyces spongiae]MPY62565.1 hypothetical protein [Streptomyces spongiae]